MKPILVILITSVALLGGCVITPDHGDHRGGGYYGGDGRSDYDHGDRDRNDHRDNDNDRDRWQGGPHY
ncbi:hypothetical protein SGO26_11795 [Cupriavidus metallidurans]|uniref:hypothetical protein n=1 Tax=Cupriavidus TaxID=106589 RepID=UPI000B0B4093|nr:MULTISPECIES: hypothetical protein [Cupriavidus]HBD37000.1 hypothetical protein [Cupriavidus sp.]HBO77114.1 hypothetical protein [Cupriavidus sp.]